MASLCVKKINKSNCIKVNEELKEYIEKNIFPEYNKNEQAHGVEHIKYVIDRSFELVEKNNLDVNHDMVYTVAAYHDIGHSIDSKTHEIISGKIMINDTNLNRFFKKNQLITIKEAIEDHRSTSKKEPRNIYGKIISSADRNETIEHCFSRTYYYGKKLDPTASDEELFLRAYDVLKERFGEDGFAKFYFKDSRYENFLKELRELLADKEKFIKAQREYIDELKNE